MPAARPLLAAAAVTSAALVLAACGADGSSVGPASTAQTLTPVTTVAAAPAAPATTQAQTAPATTTSTQEEPSSSSSSSTGSSAAPSSSVTTAGPVAQAPVGGGNADCGSTAGGFVRRITTDADCATAVKVARAWVASIQSGKDPAGVITVRVGSSFACATRFNGNRGAVLCERGGDPKQPRVAFVSQP